LIPHQGLSRQALQLWHVQARLAYCLAIARLATKPCIEAIWYNTSRRSQALLRLDSSSSIHTILCTSSSTSIGNTMCLCCTSRHIPGLVLTLLGSQRGACWLTHAHPQVWKVQDCQHMLYRMMRNMSNVYRTSVCEQNGVCFATVTAIHRYAYKDMSWSAFYTIKHE